jgi:hypothetical protein
MRHRRRTIKGRAFGFSAMARPLLLGAMLALLVRLGRRGD